MNREIKFRGKSIKSNKWIYGVPVVCRESKKTYILETAKMYSDIEFDCYDINEVYEDSIGQYTGLYDLNNKEIYEGDIIHFYENGEMVSRGHIIYIWGVWEVEFIIQDREYNPVRFRTDMRECLSTYFPYGTKTDTFKVVGNVFQNPELLKKEK